MVSACGGLDAMREMPNLAMAFSTWLGVDAVGTSRNTSFTTAPISSDIHSCSNLAGSIDGCGESFRCELLP
mgnify:CR=1 FL=1